jgi:hypothetical protein
MTAGRSQQRLNGDTDHTVVEPDRHAHWPAKAKYWHTSARLNLKVVYMNDDLLLPRSPWHSISKEGPTMATTTQTLSSGVYDTQSIISDETLISHSGPSSTAIMNSGGFYTFAINLDATVSDAQVGDLGGHGFTIIATNPGGLAVQILGSNDALDGNVLIANDPTTNGQGADLITGSAANALQIGGNQFGGVGFALAYVNGALDTYTSSQDVEFTHNKFVGTATAGVDLVDDAASGKINGNSFSGSGDGAIYLGHLSAAAATYFNAQYGTHYVYEPGTITVANNNFNHWNGADIVTFDANYTFAKGNEYHSLTATIATNGKETDTLSGVLPGDHISLDHGVTVAAITQVGTGMVNVKLSDGDHLILEGSGLNSNETATILGIQTHHDAGHTIG